MEMTEQYKKEMFLGSEYELVDATYNIDSAVSVYVYVEYSDSNVGSVWYAVNHEGTAYSIYDCLADLMEYILVGKLDTRYLELTVEEMLQIDETIDR